MNACGIFTVNCTKRTDLKKRAIIEMCNEFNQTEAEIKSKLKNLRSTYATEHNKIVFKKTGTGTDDKYESSLFYFNELSVY